MIDLGQLLVWWAAAESKLMIGTGEMGLRGQKPNRREPVTASSIASLYRHITGFDYDFLGAYCILEPGSSSEVNTCRQPDHHAGHLFRCSKNDTTTKGKCNFFFMAKEAPCLDTGLQPPDTLVLLKQMKKMAISTSPMKRTTTAEHVQSPLSGHIMLPFNLNLMDKYTLVDPIARMEQAKDTMVSGLCGEIRRGWT